MQCDLPAAIFYFFISVVMASFFSPPSITTVMSASIHDVCTFLNGEASWVKMKHLLGSWQCLFGSVHGVCSSIRTISVMLCRPAGSISSFTPIYYTEIFGCFLTVLHSEEEQWMPITLIQPAEKEKHVQHRWGYWLGHLLRNGWYLQFGILVLENSSAAKALLEYI